MKKEVMVWTGIVRREREKHASHVYKTKNFLLDSNIQTITNFINPASSVPPAPVPKTPVLGH
jgi:hypothetical protein